jgi:hypothetical protein
MIDAMTSYFSRIAIGMLDNGIYITFASCSMQPFGGWNFLVLPREYPGLYGTPGKKPVRKRTPK